MYYVYDSFKYRLYRQLTRFGNRAMHTHFIWSVWDVDLLPLEDQAKSFASVMQVGQEAECHMNPHINMVILKLYIWRLTRPLDWWMRYLAGQHHMWFMAAWSWTVLIGLIVSFSSRSYLSSIQPVKGNQKICFHGQVEIGRQQNDYETRFKYSCSWTSFCLHTFWDLLANKTEKILLYCAKGSSSIRSVKWINAVGSCDLVFLSLYFLFTFTRDSN